MAQWTKYLGSEFPFLFLVMFVFFALVFCMSISFSFFLEEEYRVAYVIGPVKVSNFTGHFPLVDPTAQGSFGKHTCKIGVPMILRRSV
jgi:hypothetical protein